MGVDVIKLTETDHATGIREQDLAKVSCSLHSVPSPAMSIWLMSVPSGQPIFPWWSYARSMDEDVQKLAAMTGISSPQGLFDFLFLVHLKRAFPAGLYTLVPGNVKTDGWSALNDPARSALQRGQSCIYRLEASMGRKLAVNWVPFYQPQVMVKDVSSDNLVRYFNAAKSDDVSNSLSFVAVDDVRKIPQVVGLLVQTDEKRSEKMTDVSDWFGVYSSPLDERYGTCAMIYTKSSRAVAALASFEKSFLANVETVRKALLAEPSPATVVRIVSRLAAL